MWFGILQKTKEMRRETQRHLV